MRRTASLITITLITATLLAGCSDDGDDSGGESWRPDPAAPTELDGDGHTPPDAVLALGDTAAVPYFDDGFADEADTVGELEVTVSEQPVEKSRDDLPTDDRGFLEDSEGTPYFVTFEITNTGETPLDGPVLVRLTGVDVTGEGLDSFATSSLPTCNGSVGTGIAPGETADLCSIVFVEDEDLAAVGYENAEEYDDHPVLWDLT